MQVMPATARDYGVDAVDQLFEPATNLHTGMRHLKRLIEKYQGIGAAVMAYNAGEGALERGQGFVDYPETQRYTHQVLVAYLVKKGIPPYSLEAQRVLGMTLTPEMALAGSGYGMALHHQAAPIPSPQVEPPRKRPPPTRLSSRLSVPGHSLLTSRLSKPTRSSAGQPGRPGRLFRMRHD